MAITRPVRPELVVAGTVAAVNPRRVFDEDTRRYTDEVNGYEVIVQQDGGAQLGVRYSLEDALPELLSRIAVITDVSESRQYGASLIFQRNATADDLDRIASALLVGAGKNSN